MTRGDRAIVPVLCDGPPREREPEPLQRPGEREVRQGVSGVLFVDQAAQRRFYRGGGDETSVRVMNAGRKEVLEREHPMRGVDVLAADGATDRGLVNPEHFGDPAQAEWSHRRPAIIEEVPLELDDRLYDAQQRMAALL